MSQSPIDFLLILIVIRNPRLQLMRSVVARLFRHQLSEILDNPLPPDPSRLHTTPTLHDPTHRPWITCTENLRFYYVQQPCLDYVLFLGFFEVVSFSLSDIRPNGLQRWDDRPPRQRPPPPRVNTNLCSFLFSCYFYHVFWVSGRGRVFFIMVENKC